MINKHCVKNHSQDQFLGVIFVYAATQASVFIKIIAVKICTAVDKEKGNYGKARRKLKTCSKKLINAEIAVFFCRKLLMFGIECDIMIFNDTMYKL